ncbi:MAG: galactokinase [Acidimicrobiales bacterium]
MPIGAHEGIGSSADMPEPDSVEVFAPGRVNLIGDHTDTTGGLVLPIAIELGTTIVARRGHPRVVLSSGEVEGVAEIALDTKDPASLEPSWARYVAGVVAELHPREGFVGTARTTIPVARGLSSSAALEVAVALALLGVSGTADADRTKLALACQRGEQRASGVQCGVMDQLASLCGIAGHALLIDCTTLAIVPVEVPASFDIVVIDSGVRRELRNSAYGERRAELEAAEAAIGPLRVATTADLQRLRDRVVRRRARHVLSENARVRAMAVALLAEDAVAAGELMQESHASLRDDFECTTPAIDATVARLNAMRGVHGARMTGGGWGGCIVALAERGAIEEGRCVRAWGPATCVRAAGPSSPRTPLR